MNRKIKIILNLLILPLPWTLRRLVFIHFMKYKIDKTAKIGRSIILAEHVEMKSNSEIENFNFINEVDEFIMEEDSRIGRQNWITGLATKYQYNFSYSKDRQCIFRLGKQSRITNFHFLDCTGGIVIGEFTTIAGIKSVFLTHAIDIKINRQTAGPLSIGKYCFVSTNCKILKGAVLPDYSVLGAGAVLNKNFNLPYGLYAGVPAKRRKDLDNSSKYFSRIEGHVN